MSKINQGSKFHLVVSLLLIFFLAISFSVIIYQANLWRSTHEFLSRFDQIIAWLLSHKAWSVIGLWIFFCFYLCGLRAKKDKKERRLAEKIMDSETNKQDNSEQDLEGFRKSIFWIAVGVVSTIVTTIIIFFIFGWKVVTAVIISSIIMLIAIVKWLSRGDDNEQEDITGFV